MDKNQVCKELIKVANELDRSGDYDLANELTKTAAEIANNRLAYIPSFYKPNIPKRSQRWQDKVNIVNRAKQTNNPALIQQATTLSNQYTEMQKQMQALSDQIEVARGKMQANKAFQYTPQAQPTAQQPAPAQPVVQQPAQPVAPTIQQPAQPVAR